MKSSFPFSKVNWVTSIFLIVTLLVALIGTPIYLWHYGLDLVPSRDVPFLRPATGMSITLGYHRLFSHLSFKASMAGEAR